MSNAVNTTEQVKQTDDQSLLMRAAHRILLAAARILVGRLPCNTAIQCLKDAYVQEARRQIEGDPNQRRVTRSALSAITGIDARHIAAMEEESREAAKATVADAFISTIELWNAGVDYADGDGKPADLPIYGSGASFQVLVRHAAGNNVTPQTVLQRLLQLGNVEYVDEQTVRLINRSYTPVKLSEMDALESGSLTYLKLSAAIERNARASKEEERVLQQDRWSYHIPRDDAPDVCQRLREIMEPNIAEVVAYLEEVEKAAKRADGPKVVVGSGWFVFSDDIDALRDFE